ncbi:cupin fold metalloprotein, WbuC family [Candidatus Pacearchaeota archaeon]|nr:cupin fold metalloprotein, WbuC family [Candidatus Pacearchaeota archaeon]
MTLFSLPKKELTELFETSKNTKRKRSAKNFQEDSYFGPQLGLNVIQPDSYIRPHFRYSDEHIIWYSGKLCSLVLDESANVGKGQILTRESPYMFLPAETYYTVVSLEKDSAIWFVTQGPFNPDRFKKNLPSSPDENGDYQEFFKFLKKTAMITDGLKNPN